MELKQAISIRIQQLCQIHNLSYHELSLLSNISLDELLKIIQNQSVAMRLLTLQKKCSSFEITLGEFFNTPEFDALEQEIK